MAVTILGDNTVSVAIVDSNAISVEVGEAPQTGVDAYGGIGPTIVVSGTHTAFIGSIGINPFVAGPNITITQSAGNIIISGASPTSVLGLATLADDVTNIDGRLDSVETVLPGASAIQGVPLVVNSSGNIRTASSYVASVNGRTGTITLNAASVTAVSNVNGRTGVYVALVAEDIAIATDGSYIATDMSIESALASLDSAVNDIDTNGLLDIHPPISHTHSTTSITSFASAVRAIGNVVSVSGKTGAVTLSQSDISSTLGTSDLAGDLLELQTVTGSVEAKFPTSAVPAGSVLTASNDGPDGTFRIKAVEGFVHSIAGCTGTVTLVQGTNITITPDVAQNQITISSTGGGGGGGTPVAAIWPALILGG
jgi:hypothetical protein